MFHRKRTGVGVALHAAALEIAYVPEGRVLTAAQVVRMPLASADYENGLVKDGARFAAQLKQAFRELGWPRHRVTVALPSSATVIRPLMVPKVKKRKLEPILRYQIGKAIALPFADAVFDIAYLSDSLEVVGERLFPGNAPTVPILFVAAASELIARLTDAFAQAELGLAVVEVKGVSTLRALRALGQVPVRPTVVLDFGVDRVEAHFYQTADLLFTHTLDLTPEKYGLEGGDWTLLQAPEAGNALEQMLPDLLRQVERLLTFLQQLLPADRRTEICELWLAGVVPEPERLQAFLRRRLEGLEVRHAARPAAFATSDATGVFNGCSLSAIGTALGGGTERADQFAS